jgi:purine-nucleoside phosphorylase
MDNNLVATARQLRDSTPLSPTIGIILGSGFQPVATALQVAKEIPYTELPGFPPVGTHCHAGKLLICTLGGKAVFVLCGRSHFYEGFSMANITYPTRLLSAAGVKTLLLTNAAGGINPAFKPGDFMILNDHINLMGANPLHGDTSGLEKFVDMSCVYDLELQRRLAAAGPVSEVQPQTGVYLAVSGPSYETPAEIRAFARLGADAVGMSTVPEAIVARQCGLRVAAVSCITNLAAGITGQPLSHAEVLATAQAVKTKGASLIENFIRSL